MQIHKASTLKHPPWLSKTAVNPPEHPKHSPILLDLSKHPKSNTIKPIYMEKIHDILHDYPDYEHIYTDGAKTKEKVGSSAIYRQRKIQKRLPDRSSIFSAEASAINLALNIISAD